MSALHFDADIDESKLTMKVNKIDADLHSLAMKAANSGSILDNSFKAAGNSAGALGSDIGSLQRNLIGLASVATLGTLGQQIISIRGEFQQLNIAFETMLGSKEKADKLMNEAVAFAAKTPFTLKDVASNIKQLLAMGIAEKDVMGTIKSLGDVSAGVSVDLSRVALNYGQVATRGKLAGEEMRDFMVSGIPLSAELAKNLGVTKTAIGEMVTAGKIGFSDVEKAFQTMSGEGGTFFNLMEKQSMSVTGQISNLADKLDVMFNGIGKQNEGLIYGGISGLSSIIDNYEGIVKVLGVLVTTYGTYRAGLMLTAAAQTMSTTAGVYDIATKNLAIGATIRAIAAQSSLNAVIMANPYVAAAAGIAALISIIYVLSEKTKTAEDYIQELNDSMAQIGKQVEIEETVQKFEELDKKVVKTKEEQDEYNKTVQKLSTIFPEAIGQTDKYGKAVDLISGKLIAQNKELRDNLILVSEKKAQDSQKGLNKLLEDQVRLQNQINTGKQVTTVKNPRAGADYNITTVFTSEEIAEKRIELALLAQSITQFGSTVEKENSDILNLKTIEANEVLSNYKNLFAGVTTFSKQQAIDTKSALQKIITPEGSKAGEMVKNQIVELDAYISKLKTTGQQHKELMAQLTTAQSKLAEINKAGYESLDPTKDKADQEAIIKVLEDKLDIKKKEKKAVDELKQAQEELENAVKSGDQAAIKRSAQKVDLLEKEEKKIKSIMELELKRAWQSQFDSTPMSEIPSIGVKPILQVGSQKTEMDTKGNKILYEITAIDKPSPVWEKVKAQFGKLKKQQKEENEKAAKDQEKHDKDITDNKIKLQEELINGAARFTNELISQLDISDKQKQALSDMVDIAANLASGNYIAAGFSAATALIPDVFTEQEKLEQAAQSVLDLYKLQNFELERQLGYLSASTGEGRVEEERKTLELIEKQKKELEAAARVLQVDAKKTESSGLFGWGSKTTTLKYTEKSQYDTIDKWKDTLEYLKTLTTDGWTIEGADDVIALIDEYEALIDQRQALLEELTGTTSSGITDVIAAGFAAGKSSIADFADDFEGMMKAAVMNVFKTQYLANASQGFFDQFAALSENGLTKDEIGELRVSWSDLLTQSKAKMDELSAISGLDFSAADSPTAQSSMKGISASYTEETLSAMVGQTMAQRVDIKTISVDIKANQNIAMNQLELLDQSLSVLNNIDRNTRNLTRLENMETKLNDINETLKKGLSV